MECKQFGVCIAGDDFFGTSNLPRSSSKDQKENILFKNENGVLFLFIAIGARFSVYSSEGKQFHFASFVMIYLIAKISKTNSSISIYYFTRACSAILLLRKYPSIALRQ